MNTQAEMDSTIRHTVNEVYHLCVKLMDRSAADITDAAIVEVINSYIKDRAPNVRINALLEERIVAGVRDELSGYGPLSKLMRDSSVSDILINGPTSIWVDCGGTLRQSGCRFRDENHLQTILERMLVQDDKALDVNAPYVDAVLKDGSRIHAVRPPISKTGLIVSIRKFRKHSISLDDLVQGDFATEECLELLSNAVADRKNIIISGGSGAGKTSFMNWLGSRIPAEERVVTIEDAAELNLDHRHTVALCSKGQEYGNSSAIDSETLLKQALRMRADRVIVGEIRGEEVMTLLQCLNIGHEGSMATIHANSDVDVISRLQLLVQLRNHNLDSDTVRSYIASSVDYIVHIEKHRSGYRCIKSVSRVGIQSDQIVIKPVYNGPVDTPDMTKGAPTSYVSMMSAR